jgi:hypothetical protein
MAAVVFAVGRAVSDAPDGLALLAEIVAGGIAYMAALPLVAKDAFAKIRAAARMALPRRAA